VEGEFIQVSSPIIGRLENLSVSRGDTVAAGDPSFVLEHALEEAAVLEAQQGVDKTGNILADLNKGKRQPEIEAIEARLDQARMTYALSLDEFKRRTALYGSGSIPQDELDRARTDMERNNLLMAQITAELETPKHAVRPDLLEATG
jgi:HlyD family secretion protein